MTNLVDRSALQLSAAIRRGEVSCTEVAAEYLRRVDELDGIYHAFSSHRVRSEVMDEAAVLDEELDRGLSRGWMHGLPHAVKDLANVRGLPTTMGFRPASMTRTAPDDDPFVAHLRTAGTNFIGKTNTPEFGLGSHTYNAIGPTTGNIVDPGLSAGGSSGGAAVAVASGMVPVADGSDYMGSLRNPPGWNGVLGLRPTIGLVPGVGEAEDSGSGVEGPIARTVADLHALLDTMAGPGRLDALVVPPAESRIRVAWLGDLGGYLPFEDGILDVCRAASNRWDGRTVSVTLPTSGAFTRMQQLWSTWLCVRHHEVGGWLAGEFSEPDIERMKPEAQWEIAGFRALNGAQLANALLVREGIRASVLSTLEHFDVLALPTAQCWPFPATLHWPSPIGGVSMDTYHRWMEVTTLATLGGLPALSVPAGVNGSGHHIGLQLVGRPGCDGELLGWAARAEREGVFEVALPTKVVPA